MHWVKSSYYNFRDTLGKHCYLREYLEIVISKVDIWGYFEDSLAHVDSAAIIDCLNTHLDILNVKDEFDDDYIFDELLELLNEGK